MSNLDVPNTILSNYKLSLTYLLVTLTLVAEMGDNIDTNLPGVTLNFGKLKLSCLSLISFRENCIPQFAATWLPVSTENQILQL